MTRHLAHIILLAATLAAMPQLAVARGSTPAVDSLGVEGGWLQQDKLSVPVTDEPTLQSFGFAVAVSGDTALVGSPFTDVDGNLNQGAVYVFTRDAGGWQRRGRLTANDGTAVGQFGVAIALSGDTAVVGANFATVDGTLQGAAYVFTRDSGGWNQRAKLVANEGAADDQFGASVALSQETVLVGAPFADAEGDTDRGAAYVFIRGGESWNQQVELNADGGAPSDHFGSAVALAGDVALVGASAADVDGEEDQGAAYAFARDGGRWIQEGTLVGENDFHEFGTSVALAVDGNTALVGAPNTEVNIQGAAFVFTRNDGIWSPQATLFAFAGGSFDDFGTSVALADDGNTALVGAPGLGGGEGTADVWTRAGQQWTARASLGADDGAAEDGLGSSVALSGATAVAGAPFVGDPDRGAAYVFVPSLAPARLDVDPTPVDSDGNGVFEPGETVEMAPAWRNNGDGDASADGILSHFTGPPGASYDIAVNGSAYGPIPPGETGSCQDTGSCPQLEIQITGGQRPAPHWDATVAEELQVGPEDTLAHTWALHVGESFTDVSHGYLFYRVIENIFHNGITTGCNDTDYCPGGANTRGQMSVFVLRSREGEGYQPPACEGGERMFADVPADHLFCSWIEELARRDVVVGCGGNNFCPGDPVTRAQMAIFLLRTLEGAAYTPPACSGRFADVPCPGLFTDWIEDLFQRQITGGCRVDPLAYCPAEPVTRGQMAAFLSKTFGLTLYGP